MLYYNVKQAFEFNMQWRMVTPIAPPAKVLPVFRNITMKNFTGEANSLGSINGLKDSPITGITFVNCNLKVQQGLTTTNTYNNDYSGLNAEVKEGKKIIEISE
jgi:exo-poly-alpha-galacturonosidase